MNVNFKQKLLKPLCLIGIALIALYTSVSHSQTEQADSSGQAKLEQLLAPIALYPDTILSHILVASTYPLEVVQAERWLELNQDDAGDDAVEAAQGEDWDPSVLALVAFPNILKRMSEDLEWTQQLGEAFLQDQEHVLASVQNLRELAQQAGSLDEMDRVTITKDELAIIIEPRDREIVYVPYYDTRVVYGDWRWRHYPPVYWDYPYSHAGFYDHYYPQAHSNFFYWGPRISLSFGFFSNTFHWRNHHLVRIAPRHYRPYRYYGHHDILRHRHATRWVHDARRGHHSRQYGGKRNVARDNSRDRKQNQFVGGEKALNRDSRIQRGPRREQMNQQRIRDRLVRNRNQQIRSNTAQRAVSPRPPSVRSQNSSSSRTRAVNNQPTRNSRAALPGQGRAGEDVRREANRLATRPIQRQSMVLPPKARVNRAARSGVQSKRAAAPAAQPRRAPPARSQSHVQRQPSPSKQAKQSMAERKRAPAKEARSSRRNNQRPR